MVVSPRAATKCSPSFIKMTLDVFNRGTVDGLNAATTVSIIWNKRLALYGQLTVIPSEVSHSRAIRLSFNTSGTDETIITHCDTLNALVVSMTAAPLILLILILIHWFRPLLLTGKTEPPTEGWVKCRGQWQLKKKQPKCFSRFTQGKSYLHCFVSDWEVEYPDVSM